MNRDSRNFPTSAEFAAARRVSHLWPIAVMAVAICALIGVWRLLDIEKLRITPPDRGPSDVAAFLGYCREIQATPLQCGCGVGVALRGHADTAMQLCAEQRRGRLANGRRAAARCDQSRRHWRA